MAYDVALVTCSIDGCEKPKQARGLCPMHYQRQRIRGDVGSVGRERQSHAGRICVVDGCNTKRRKRDWCAAHYSQWQRLGEVKPFGYHWAVTGAPCPVCEKPTGQSRGNRRYCGICRLPVDMDLSAPDPMRASVDHIWPRALGGTNDPENLQLAHLRCNSVKQHRVGKAA